MISECRTRNRGDLQIPKVRLECAKRSFYFSGVKNLNDVPDNVRERDSITRFRTDLRDYLLNLSQDPNTTPWSMNITIFFSFSHIIFEQILSIGY